MNPLDDLDPELALLRRERAVRAFLPLFFASGATSLVYQTVWGRQLHLVFGTSTFAITTVLAAFMAGLAIGGLAMGRVADRLRRPLRAYGAMELVIGGYALGFPSLLDALTPLYLGAWHTLRPGPVGFGLVQLGLVGAALLLPTALMGATLPLLARFATDRMGATGDRIATLYAVNTAGAVFGTWAAGFVLLPTLGVWKTTVVAASANVCLGLASLALDRWSAPELALEAPRPQGPPHHPVLAPVVVAMALAGFSSLAFEVIWTRVLGLLLGPSVYAFSIMLLAVLVGIAVGGRAGGPLADRAWSRGGLPSVLVLLAAVEVGVGATGLGLMWLYPELPYWYVWLFDALEGERHPGSMWVVSTITALLATTPPAVLMGVAFPVAARAVVDDPSAPGRPLGAIYGANTLGGVAGALTAGFVLLPSVAVSGAVFVAVAVNALAAAGLLVAARARRALPAGSTRLERLIAASAVLVVLAAVHPPWSRELMTSGMYHYVSHFRNHSRAGIDHFSVRSYDLLYYAEGLSTVLTVGRNHEDGGLWMAHNGKVEASAEGDRPTQVLAGILALPFAPGAEDALVIGLASGITAGALARSGALRHLDVAEIEPNTLHAARFFDAWSGAVLDDPRVRVVLNDGRNHLLLAPPATWDIVVNQPSNPWISGVSNLFTLEFYRLGKSRLRPGGVWVQWIQTYGLAPDDLRSLVGTFAAVHDHVLLFATRSKGDLLLLGSDRPLRADLDRLRATCADPRVGPALEAIGLADPIALLAHLQMDREGVVAMAGGIGPNTDDNLRVEYSAPRTVHAASSLPNVELVEAHARVAFEEVGGDPHYLAALARAYLGLDEPARATRAMSLAIAGLDRDDPERALLQAELADWAADP